MTSKHVAVAVVLAAAATFSSTADAAGGVRLGFGGPLGTFTATPSKGAGSSNLHAHRVKQAARKSRAAAPVRETARRSEKVAPRIAAQAEHAPRAPRSSEAPRQDVAKADIASDRVAPLTGSSALIQSALPDTEHDEMRAPTGHEATAEAPAGQDSAVDAEETATEASHGESRGTATCSKFIPAVGMTVTVACDD